MSATQRCPKCGRDNDGDAVICAACDFILDSSFLGDDILDEPSGDALSENTPFGGDAVILGKLHAENEYESFLGGDSSDFLVAPTSMGVRALTPAQVYVDAATRALLEPNAVLSVKEGVTLDTVPLSPFEAHVAQFINGQRPVARVQVLSELSEDDLRICLSMLADKGLIERSATAAPADVPRTAADVETEAAGFEDGATELSEGLPPALSPDTDPPAPAMAPPDFDAEAVRAVLAEDTLSPFSDEEPVSEPPLAASTASPLPDQSTAPPLPGQSMAPPLPGQAPSMAPPLPGQTPAPATPPAAAPAPAAAAPARRKAPTIIDSTSQEEPAPPAPEPETPAPAARSPEMGKAEQLYEAALTDIQAGRMPRAKGLAAMAYDLCPDEPRFKELATQWGKAREIAARSAAAPDDVRFFHLAKAAEKAGNFDEAIALLEKAKKANPKAAQIHNQLGVLLATHKKDFTAALSCLFRAVELDKKNTAYRNNLGKVLALSGSDGNVSFDDIQVADKGKKDDDKGGRWAKLKGKLF